MKDGRSLDHKTLEGYRFAAVELNKRNVSVLTIAESFGVTTEAVYIWLKKARINGIRSLKSSKTLGREPFLKKEQFYELLRTIRQRASKEVPDQDRLQRTSAGWAKDRICRHDRG